MDVNVVQILGFLGIAGGGVAGLFKLLRVLREFMKLQRAASELLMAQLRPNGGHSLLDRFTKMEDRQLSMEKVQDCMRAKVEGIEGGQNIMAGSIDAIRDWLTDGDARLDAIEAQHRDGTV